MGQLPAEPISIPCLSGSLGPDASHVPHSIWTLASPASWTPSGGARGSGSPRVEPAQSAQGPASLGVCTQEPHMSSALGRGPTWAEQDPSRQQTTGDRHTPGPQPLWSRASRRFHGQRKETLTSGGGPGPEEEDAKSQDPESHLHGPAAASQLRGSACANAGITVQGDTQKQSHQQPLRTNAAMRAFPGHVSGSVSICGQSSQWLVAPSITRPSGGPGLRGFLL